MCWKGLIDVGVWVDLFIELIDKYYDFVYVCIYCVMYDKLNWVLMFMFWFNVVDVCDQVCMLLVEFV